ncbi:MAG: NAD(P)-dependent oxidoreductase [Acidobacteria bacterium]|nr:NAD(P)-dependent oxidoreductase [Acidobacteriota bacterium]
MKVTLFGGSGMIGSRILQELISRGHSVTAVVRNPSKITGAAALAGDVLDPARVAAASTGADAVISAYAPPADDPAKLSAAARTLGDALPRAGVKRLLLVGGAGGLEVAPGVRLVDTPEFPTPYKPYALAHIDAVDQLKGTDLDWTVLSPAAIIEPGERTGKFRLGTNQLVTDAKGDSRISAEDYAIALVDELEKPQHIRQRFTVGY